MSLVVYKEPEGIFLKIKQNYEKSREILSRYTLDELKDWKRVDLYFVLGLDHLKDEDIPENVLKTAYRRKVIEYHPDSGKVKGNTLYFVVQRAYNVIGNESSRKKYDSIFFDEEIPEDREYNDEEFFDIFGTAFVKNSKFSIKKPVPSFGDKDTKIEEVESFYKFWKTFESWRSFEYLDDEETENMSRDERRYIENKNKNRRNKKKNEDIIRIKKLVDIGIKRDPRVRNYRKSNVKNVTEELDKLSVKIPQKLISNLWPENDVKILVKLMDVVKNGQKNRWTVIAEKYNNESSNKKNAKNVLVKCNEISRMMQK